MHLGEQLPVAYTTQKSKTSKPSRCLRNRTRKAARWKPIAAGFDNKEVKGRKQGANNYLLRFAKTVAMPNFEH